MDRVVDVLLLVVCPVSWQIQLHLSVVLELLHVSKSDYLAKVLFGDDHDLPHVRVQHTPRVPGQRGEHPSAVVVFELPEALHANALANGVVDVVVCLHVIMVQLKYFFLFVVIQEHLWQRK